MKRVNGKRLLAVFLAMLLTAGMSAAVFAETAGTVTRIYGTEDRAIACKGFTDFYASNMFIWFQMDTDVACASGMQTMMNQQVLGDSVLKDAAGSKIKIGGMTVKQINVSAGNPYTAMVAFENNGSDKVRVSVWMAWGSQAVQDIFQKEVHSTVTVELVSGFKVPDNGYSTANKVYASISPVKYSLDITELEYLSDPTNPGYNEAVNGSWVKPMFENLTAQWQLTSGVTPTNPPSSSNVSSAASSAPASSTAGTSSQAGSTPASQVSAASSETLSETASETVSSESSETASSEPSESSGTASAAESAASSQAAGSSADDGGTPVLPIVLAVLGAVIIAGGIGYFLVMQKKAK